MGKIAKTKTLQVLSPIDSSTNEILVKLQKYEKSLSERIEAIKLTSFVANMELAYWEPMLNRTKTMAKQHSKDESLRNIDYLRKIAQSKCDYYFSQTKKFQETDTTLEATYERVRQAVVSMELNRELGTLMDGLDFSDGHNVEFDFAIEERDIRQLLHSTDAFLEITQLGN